MTRKIGPYEHYLHIETSADDYERLKAAGINGAHHWNTDRQALDALARTVEEIAPKAMLMYCSGTDMRVRGTRVSVLQLPSCMQYEVRQDLGYGYKILHSDEELADCDCLLSSMINEDHPKVQGLPCGTTIKVISTKIVESADFTSDEQLEYWINGRDIHRSKDAEQTIKFTNLNEGECCPDFGCCAPTTGSVEARKAYYNAHKAKDSDTKQKLLMGFLGSAVLNASEAAGDKPKSTYIAGSGPARSTKLN